MAPVVRIWSVVMQPNQPTLSMITRLIEFFWPPLRWARNVREDNSAYRLWYIENVVPWWRDEWPKLVMLRHNKPTVLSGFRGDYRSCSGSRSQ